MINPRRCRRGISLVEGMLAVGLMALVSLLAYRMLFAPFKMDQILSQTTDREKAVASLDFVVTDLQKSDASSFPQITSTGNLFSWITLTNQGSAIPYTFVYYDFEVSQAPIGGLYRYVCSSATYSGGVLRPPPSLSDPSVSKSLLIASIAQPGTVLPDGSTAPPLFTRDVFLNPSIVTVQIAYVPSGVKTSSGKQAVFSALRQAALRT